MDSASPLPVRQGLTAPPWLWCLAKLTCPFQSWRLCSARNVVWEEVVVPDIRAWSVCSGELQELAVQPPHCPLSAGEVGFSVPSMPASEELGTEEEPALKTCLGVSQLPWRRTRRPFHASLQDDPRRKANA